MAESGPTPTDASDVHARIAALERQFNAWSSIIGPDGSIRASRVVVGDPGKLGITLCNDARGAYVEVGWRSDEGAFTGVMTFASLDENHAAVGLALYGTGECLEGTDMVRFGAGHWTATSLASDTTRAGTARTTVADVIRRLIAGVHRRGSMRDET